MKIGDRVRIVGPACNRYTRLLGDVFKITKETKDQNNRKYFSTTGYLWYPESSLELVSYGQEPDKRMTRLKHQITKFKLKIKALLR